jgi:hypothetical protein
LLLVVGKDKTRRSVRAAKWAVCGHDDDKGVHAVSIISFHHRFFRFCRWMMIGASLYRFISKLAAHRRSPYVLSTWKKSCAIARRRLWPPNGMPSDLRPKLAATPSLVVHSIIIAAVVVRGAIHPPLRYIRAATTIRADWDPRVVVRRRCCVVPTDEKDLCRSRSEGLVQEGGVDKARTDAGRGEKPSPFRLRIYISSAHHVGRLSRATRSVGFRGQIRRRCFRKCCWLGGECCY